MSMFRPIYFKRPLGPVNVPLKYRVEKETDYGACNDDTASGNLVDPAENLERLLQSHSLDDDEPEPEPPYQPLWQPPYQQTYGGPVDTVPERLVPQWNRPTDPLEAKTPTALGFPVGVSKEHTESPLAKKVTEKEEKAEWKTKFRTNPSLELRDRLAPEAMESSSFPSGFPTMPSQQDFQRSSQSLLTDPYSARLTLSPSNPTYHLGMPDSLKQKRENYKSKREYESCFLSRWDDDPTGEKRKTRDSAMSSLSLVPFCLKGQEQMDRGKKHKEHYFVTGYKKDHAVACVDEHLSDAGGAEYIYEMCVVLDKIHKDMAYIRRNKPTDRTTGKSAVDEKLTDIYNNFHRFRKLYNKSLYGTFIDSICEMCACMNHLKQYIKYRRPKVEPDGLMQIYWSMKEALRAKWEELRFDVQKKAKLRHEIKKYVERLQVDPPNTEWQNQRLPGAMSYKLEYEQRGKLGHVFSQAKMIPSVGYLEQRGLTPSQWVEQGHTFEASSPLYPRRRLEERQPTSLQEKEISARQAFVKSRLKKKDFTPEDKYAT